MVTSRRRRPWTAKSTAFVTWSSGAGVDDACTELRVPPRARVGAFLAALPTDVQRVVLVGAMPGKTGPGLQAWATDDLAGVIETAGYAPTEAGILWANHAVRATEKLPDAERPAGEIPEWTWDELTAAADRPAQRQLNVRIPRKLYGDCEAAAAAAGLKLRPWVESVLVAAVQDLD